MENVLQFIANYNTQIIKGGFAIVFLLLIIYVYRLFFVASATAPEGSLNTDALEQKLNQLLENQKTKAATEPAEVSDVATAEIDRLKLEVYGLKQQLAEAEKKAVEVVATAAPSAPAADPNTPSPAQAELIKSLESRLAEYEIIAEDIAELTQLRNENTSLKAQLTQLGATPNNAPASAAASEPMIDESVLSAEPEVPPVIEKPIAAEPEPILEAEPAVTPEVEAAPVINETEAATAPSETSDQSDAERKFQAALEEAAAAVGDAMENPNTDEVLAAASAEISAEDQKLLEEFEQTVNKKGS